MRRCFYAFMQSWQRRCLESPINEPDHFVDSWSGFVFLARSLFSSLDALGVMIQKEMRRKNGNPE